MLLLCINRQLWFGQGLAHICFLALYFIPRLANLSPRFPALANTLMSEMVDNAMQRIRIDSCLRLGVLCTI